MHDIARQKQTDRPCTESRVTDQIHAWRTDVTDRPESRMTDRPKSRMPDRPESRVTRPKQYMYSVVVRSSACLWSRIRILRFAFKIKKTCFYVFLKWHVKKRRKVSKWLLYRLLRTQSRRVQKVSTSRNVNEKLVKVIWQKAPHGGPIPRLGITQGVESCTIEFLG